LEIAIQDLEIRVNESFKPISVGAPQTAFDRRNNILAISPVVHVTAARDGRSKQR
jgi:hypothetical protein